MNILQKKKEQYFSNWFLKAEIDLFESKMEKQIRKEAKNKINYLNFEELDCIPDWINGERKEIVR